jgi:hypothetical protein
MWNVLSDLLINQPIENPKGLLKQGNIDLYSRPLIKNPDGSTSTVRSMSFNPNGIEEVVIPTAVDGKILSDEDAIQNYFKTGQHLGKFKTALDAIEYANNLHKQQQNLYGL